MIVLNLNPIKFVEHPVVCKVNSIAVKTGKSNCTWSSCREGCTADMYKCFQVGILDAFMQGASRGQKSN